MAKAARKVYLKDDEKRIESVAPLIKGGYVKTWAAIFDIVPRTVVAQHLGTSNNRMKALVEDPSTLSLQHLAEIASFLQVDFLVLADLANKARVKAKVKKK